MADEVEFGSRPWHGSDNPFEAMWQHFTAEIEKLRGGSAEPVENAGTVEALPMHDTNGGGEPSADIPQTQTVAPIVEHYVPGEDATPGGAPDVAVDQSGNA